MMEADPTKTAFAGRGDGLIFDWEIHRTPRFAKLAMLALAVIVFVLPLMVVRIRVGAPPVQEAHSAGMMMLAPGNDPMHWLEAARDLGPFPSRFDPADWQPSASLVEDVLAGVRARSLPGHEPQFQDLPGDGPPPSVPLVSKGARHLPSVGLPEFKPMDAMRVRPAPVLYPLSEGAVNLPDAGPRFHVEVTPEMAFQPWRFLLQIAPDGTVLSAVALIGHNTPGRAQLTAWLQGHRFPPHDDAHDRWVAVAVTFRNQISNGTDAP